MLPFLKGLVGGLRSIFLFSTLIHILNTDISSIGSPQDKHMKLLAIFIGGCDGIDLAPKPLLRQKASGG
jgi:hypothetical protein